MKQHYFLLKTFVLIALIFISIHTSASEASFNQQQVLEDISNLYESLIETHYNPYAYISKKQLKRQYKTLKSSVTKSSYSLLETIKLYQQLVSSINNGHTEIDFPAASYFKYAESGGTLFPMEITIEDNKALIRANHSIQSSIKKGTELLEINGQPISAILNEIYPLISAERQYFKNAKLEVYTFPRYYWYAYGQQDSFVITVRNQDSVTQHTVEAIDVFDDFEAKKDEILDAQPQIDFFDDTAYLNPGHFSGNESKYQQFIENAFAEINAKASKNLIIDLRNNSGGNDSFSDYLVSYIADKAFKWNSEFSLRTSTLLKQDTKINRDLTKPYWRSIMDNETGTQYEFQFDQHPPVSKNKRYKGKVYVLVNRHSHSQAAVTAAQIQDYGWGLVVGEETGDYATLYASQFQYALPNTGIVVKISKGYIVRVNGSKKPTGVIPTIIIKDHLLDETDEILTGLLRHLSS